MSIYIKNLYKPTTCSNCFAFRYDYEDGIAICNISNEIIKRIPYEDRLLDSVISNIKSEDCPIIEVENEYENILSVQCSDCKARKLLEQLINEVATKEKEKL